MSVWAPYSWQVFPVAQSVVYDDSDLVLTLLQRLEQSAPLVAISEIFQLRDLLIKAGRGDAFVVQGGDCCELFSECNPVCNFNKISILQAMGEILQSHLNTKVIKIGRMAGQYAKPRSSDTEVNAGDVLPVYRGDMINAYDFNSDARRPDPLRMMQAYQCSQKTLGYIKDYDASVFVSHEALHLPYEAALTRELQGYFYNLSTHLPWLGMRTLDAGGAHVEYLRGIENPIGIKVGPENVLPQVLKVMEILNPKGMPGKIVLIHRFGHRQVADRLPDLLSAVKAQGLNTTVICDPMHGNTCMNSQGLKIRHFDDIVTELSLAFAIHQAHGLPLAGIHFEMTGDDVSECIGGTDIMDHELKIYTSRVDPRLNRQQALRLAERFVDICRGR